MIKHFLNFVVILLLLYPGSIRAQQSVSEVIFEDDFSHDKQGTFPHRWRVMPGADSAEKRLYFLQKEKKGYSLAINNMPLYGACITPDINIHRPDSLIICFDFNLESDAISIILNFGGTWDTTYGQANTWLGISNDKENYVSLNLWCIHSSYPNQRARLSSPSAEGEWHHFTATLFGGTLRAFIDNHKLISYDEKGYTPGYYNMSMVGKSKFTNFRMVAKYKGYHFEQILTEKKFVTHAINFDVNKSIIKPESMEFMAQLAQFLKTNPSVNLEIDGHTDNDGDASANLALSLNRANEVRHKLTESGIDGKRLTTRGFGATKPLQPNSTPEAKANNRRVEFIKL